MVFSRQILLALHLAVVSFDQDLPPNTGINVVVSWKWDNGDRADSSILARSLSIFHKDGGAVRAWKRYCCEFTVQCIFITSVQVLLLNVRQAERARQQAESKRCSNEEGHALSFLSVHQAKSTSKQGLARGILSERCDSGDSGVI